MTLYRTDMFESAQKPKRCPGCGSSRITSIINREQLFHSEAERNKKQEKIIIESNRKSEVLPAWRCEICKTNIFRTSDFNFSKRVIYFNRNLRFEGSLPRGIRIMNPFLDNDEVMNTVRLFYEKYYNDNCERYLILGINPGRFGAGATGVPFTDTKRLREKCRIEINSFQTHEPSSVFIYEVIDAYGGVKKFYSDFYINSICPLGFTAPGKNGKEINYNYYDSRELMTAVYNFIIKSLEEQLQFPVKRDVCFCLGTGKNFEFLSRLNNKFHFFQKIITLDHPRYVMQYKSKLKNQYIDKYIKLLKDK